MFSSRSIVSGALLLLWVGTAHAQQDAVVCKVRAIHGLQGAGQIDKRLAPLKRQFSKPPFSAYKTIKLLSSTDVVVKRGKMGHTKLPTKKIVKLSFKERLLDAKRRVRLRMHLSITPPRAVGFLPGTLFTIADGGTLLVGGDAFNGGTLIVGITCKTK